MRQERRSLLVEYGTLDVCKCYYDRVRRARFSECFSDVVDIGRCALHEIQAGTGCDAGWVADEGCHGVASVLLQDVVDDLAACLAAAAYNEEVHDCSSVVICPDRCCDSDS